MMRTPSPLFYCIVSLIFLVGPASAESQERVTLARAGKSSCVIVQADNATEPEKFAAKELATFSEASDRRLSFRSLRNGH